MYTFHSSLSKISRCTLVNVTSYNGMISLINALNLRDVPYYSLFQFIENTNTVVSCILAQS